MKELSTDIDREFKDYEDDPEQTSDLKVLALVVFTVVSFWGAVLLIIFSGLGFFQ